MTEGQDPNTSEGTEERRERVARELEESLLNESFFGRRSTVGSAEADSSWTGRSRGEELGDFRLVGLLGRGGMGQVWEAEQISMGRNVALKLLHSHVQLAGDGVERFQREARAGGRLTHNGIVQIFSVGEFEGVHFMAQEMVEGSYTLADSLAEFRQETEVGDDYYPEVARLFAEIAEALSHAHENGVVHRDIKPSNILIGPDDKPKVADFGLALVEDLVGLSRTGEIMGTPLYMSPEQAATKRIGIDHRTDIFSLGATLYEALTLARPFHGDTSRQIFDQIMSVDPVDPRRLRSRVPDDMAVICLKALEKRREDRYSSMAAFAEDLRRHLANKPIQAQPPTTLQRMVKWTRRNPTKSAVSGVAAAAFAVISWLLVENIQTNEALEDGQAKLLSSNLELAEQKEEAEKAQEVAQRVADFQAEQLSSLNMQDMGVWIRRETLHHARVAGERAGTTPDVLDEQTEELERLLAGTAFPGLALGVVEEFVFREGLEALEEYEDQPLYQAKLQQTIATTLREVGLYELASEPQSNALEIRRRELGDEHLDTLESITMMGALLLNDSESAEPYLKEALETIRRVMGDEAEATDKERATKVSAVFNMGSLMSNYGRLAEAEGYYREALNGFRALEGDDGQNTLAACSVLASELQKQAKFDEAESFYIQALEGFRRTLGDDDPDTLSAIHGLGSMYGELNRFEEANPLLLEALDGRRLVLGEDHPHSMESRRVLATNLWFQGKPQEGLSHLQICLESSLLLYGEMSPKTARVKADIGALLHTLGQYAEAERYMRDALESRRTLLGDEHLETLRSIQNMAGLLSEQGRLAEAQPLWEEAHAVSTREFGEDHPDTLMLSRSMAVVMVMQGKFEEAEVSLRRTLELCQVKLGDDHYITLNILSALSAALEQQGKIEEALPFMKRVLDTRRRLFGEDHKETIPAIQNMGVLYYDLGKYEESEAYIREALEKSRRLSGDVHIDTLFSLGVLGPVLIAQAKREEAEVVFKEAVEIGRKISGGQHPNSLKAFKDMATFLRDDGRLEEAESHARELISKTRDGDPNRAVYEQLLETILAAQREEEEGGEERAQEEEDS